MSGTTTIITDGPAQAIEIDAAGTEVTILDPAQEVLLVQSGPPGPPGSTGGSVSYVHTQAVAASSWVINHNLGFYPSYTVEEAGTGHVIMGAEIHHSNDQLEIQFNTPRAGTARLS